MRPQPTPGEPQVGQKGERLNGEHSQEWGWAAEWHGVPISEVLMCKRGTEGCDLVMGSVGLVDPEGLPSLADGWVGQQPSVETEQLNRWFWGKQ